MDKVVKAIEVFVHETGYFPTKKDFNSMKELPSYTTFISLNVRRNNQQIELLRNQSQREIPRLSYPSSKMLNVAKEYRSRCGFPITFDMERWFYIASLDDGTRVSFFDTPIVLGHKHRWEEIKDEIVFISPNKIEWLIGNIGVFAEHKKKHKKDEEETSTLLSSLLGASD